MKTRLRGDDRPKVISLFSGAGGLDYGLEAAGFTTAVAVDIDPEACATLQSNREWNVLKRSVHDLAPTDLLEASKLKRGEVDLLAGGPPCQPFSKSSYWKNGQAGRLSDPRARTLDAYLSIVEQTLPSAFLLENVEGLAYAKADEGLQLLLAGIDRIRKKCGAEYSVATAVLDAAEYGVPQHRQRFVLVALRDAPEFVFPAPTHGKDRLPFATAWDAIGDLPADPKQPELAIGGQWADLVPSIPEGSNYLWHTERGGGRNFFGWRCKYWSFLLKLAKKRPSWTIQAQPGTASGPFHWRNRRLSMRELARLQTFPDNVTVAGMARTPEGRHLAIQRQIGNAVPSLLGEVLGRAIAKQLGLRHTKGPLTLLPPTRAPVPARHPVGPVPSKYDYLERTKHAAHPGVGRGPGARARAVAAAAE